MFVVHPYSASVKPVDSHDVGGAHLRGVVEDEVEVGHGRDGWLPVGGEDVTGGGGEPGSILHQRHKFDYPPVTQHSLFVLHDRVVVVGRVEVDGVQLLV